MEQPYLPNVLFRSVEVTCTTSEINEIYFACDIDSRFECKKKYLSGHECFPFIDRVIAKGLPPWENGVGQIKRRELLVQDKHCLGFISNCLLYSRNDQNIMI